MNSRLLFVLCFTVWFAGVPVNGGESEEPSLFPFVVSNDAPRNATHVGTWEQKAASAKGRVRVQNGGFATDAGPWRAWGVNLCFSACFPERDQAEAVAARLARFGVNCVRMHHMDARDIWGKSGDKTTIDPEQIERLDYLIYQLKQHGIYTNLNLHVSRTLGPEEGFPNADERPRYDKGLDNFAPRMIALQKKYAHDLLTHVNPYTEQSYAKDPAIAFVEINNENALYHSWHRGALNDLPEPYLTTFRRLWNEWLRDKYGSTAALREAWDVGAVPLGDSMLANGDFQEPLGEGWHLEEDEKTVVDWSVRQNGPQGRAALTVDVDRQGEVNWRPQFSHTNVSLKEGHPYTLTFWARADQPREIQIHMMMNHAPWQRIGLQTAVELTTEWQRFRRVFVAEQGDDDARLTISDLPPSEYQFADISLRPGGLVGLRAEETLKGDQVALMFPAQMERTEVARDDYAKFLWDLERRYWAEMYRYLLDELGVRALVSGTQLGYSPVTLQAQFDYLDAHSYWHHPSFPGRPWDRNNWFVRNLPLVNEPGGTLASLASRRVIGKPYTVSEYNHPAPNSYAAEAFPMIASWGGFQDWSGIYAFAYSHNREFEAEMVSSFFDIKADPTRLVHLPACHALFVRGDVAAAREQLAAEISPRRELEVLERTFNPRELRTERFGVDAENSLRHAIGLELKEEVETEAPRPVGPAAVERYVSDTGELTWDVEDPEAGYFVVDAPRSKLLTGFLRGRLHDLGVVQVRVGETRLDWATLSLVCLDGSTFAEPGRVLVAASGWMQNRGAELEELGQNRVTLGSDWGEPPVMCEGVPATLRFSVPPHRVQAYPLDPSGQRREALKVQSTADGKQTLIELSPDHETLWYELEITRS